MSEEIGAGVKILLERGKSNPDEVMEDYGMWGPLVEAVFTCVETGQRSSRIRGLTDHEIKLLFEMFNAIYRTQFDSWVMKNVLGAGDEEGLPLDAYGLSLGKQRLQGTVQPGTWQNVATQTSDTPLRVAIKRKLGIK
jgi:hypothetical protein